MLTLRGRDERGEFEYGWLKTRHTFSFGDYQDPTQMGFRSLRVINEDWVQPGQGFAPHRHRDMEIITYVISGQLKHEDNLGNGSLITPGELQRMSAGTGIQHSEFNPSETEPVHLLQIWIRPEEKDLPPSYEQKRFDPQDKVGSFALLASPTGGAHCLKIHQDVNLYATLLRAGATLHFGLRPERHAWIQVVSGQVICNDLLMKAGDGAAVSEQSQLSFSADEEAELLLFDLA